jgi:hypothetical protein
LWEQSQQRSVPALFHHRQRQPRWPGRDRVAGNPGSGFFGPLGGDPSAVAQGRACRAHSRRRNHWRLHPADSIRSRRIGTISPFLDPGLPTSSSVGAPRRRHLTEVAGQIRRLHIGLITLLEGYLAASLPTDGVDSMPYLAPRLIEGEVSEQSARLPGFHVFGSKTVSRV